MSSSLPDDDQLIDKLKGIEDIISLNLVSFYYEQIEKTFSMSCRVPDDKIEELDYRLDNMTKLTLRTLKGINNDIASTTVFGDIKITHKSLSFDYGLNEAVEILIKGTYK